MRSAFRISGCLVFPGRRIGARFAISLPSRGPNRVSLGETITKYTSNKCYTVVTMSGDEKPAMTVLKKTGAGSEDDDDEEGVEARSKRSTTPPPSYDEAAAPSAAKNKAQMRVSAVDSAAYEEVRFLHGGTGSRLNCSLKETCSPDCTHILYRRTRSQLRTSIYVRYLSLADGR